MRLSCAHTRTATSPTLLCSGQVCTGSHTVPKETCTEESGFAWGPGEGEGRPDTLGAGGRVSDIGHWTLWDRDREGEVMRPQRQAMAELGGFLEEGSCGSNLRVSEEAPLLQASPRG